MVMLFWTSSFVWQCSFEYFPTISLYLSHFLNDFDSCCLNSPSLGINPMPCARKYKILGIKKSCSPSFDAWILIFFIHNWNICLWTNPTQMYSWYLARLLHWILLSLNRPSLSKPKNSSYMLFHTNIDKILNKTNKKVNTIFITQPILTCSFICDKNMTDTKLAHK